MKNNKSPQDKYYLGAIAMASAIVFGALTVNAFADGGSGKNACAADIQTLCPTAQTWKDKQACLNTNASSLSTACTQARANWKAKREKRKAEFEAACGADIKATCSNVIDAKEKPWEVIRCLKDNENNISTACQTELKKMHRHHHHHKKQQQSSSSSS